MGIVIVTTTTKEELGRVAVVVTKGGEWREGENTQDKDRVEKGDSI